MSEKEKNCGSCKFWKAHETSAHGECDHPIVKAPTPLCVQVRVVVWKSERYCPCHEPREEK